MNYHCINVKITWVVSTAALDRENIPALRNPALAFWAVTAVGYTCLRRAENCFFPTTMSPRTRPILEAMVEKAVFSGLKNRNIQRLKNVCAVGR